MKLLILLLVLLLSGCGPGLKDGMTHIKNGYYFAFMGADQNIIYYEGNEREEGVIIDSMVTQFLMVDEVLYLSRRSLIYDFANGLRSLSGKGNCQYYAIDTDTHKISGPFSKEQVIEMKDWLPLIRVVASGNVMVQSRYCKLNFLAKPVEATPHSKLKVTPIQN
ncbi:hypothetical protein [Pseudoalteromonas rubra]|uniref:Lipoprotein n=1 Tax=Pseudoalteromonas rubra TaxID=43658 RepID=A0A0U2Y0B9_9GAMM|nr:hypothetical protein [Pseudoalteromonas rubra]ALU43682.1 hypothetical protein AT705_12415 [Pseudoalteromonas rubra]